MLTCLANNVADGITCSLLPLLVLPGIVTTSMQKNDEDALSGGLQSSNAAAAIIFENIRVISR